MLFGYPVGLLVRVAHEFGQATLGVGAVGKDPDQKKIAVIVLAPEFKSHADTPVYTVGAFSPEPYTRPSRVSTRISSAGPSPDQFYDKPE
jgi:hypothetical protein